MTREEAIDTLKNGLWWDRKQLDEAYQLGSWNKDDGWIIDEYLEWTDADVLWWRMLPAPPDCRPPEKKEETNMDKPRICEVIGVKVNQIFKFSDLIFVDTKEYFINENGEIKSVNGEEVTCKEVCRIVNNHDYITRCDELLFTDQERNLMKLFQDACVDTVYIKREKYGGLSWYSSNSTNLENHLLPVWVL